MRGPQTFNNTTSAFRPFDTTSVLRPAKLFCPECARLSRESLLVKRPAGKVDFHHCTTCGGAWFQDREIDDALRLAGACDWPELAAPPAENQVLELKDWACPCCRGNLVAIRDRNGSGASVRRCLVCYGGWIEHADLKVAVEASRDLLSRLGRSVRHMFGKA